MKIPEKVPDISHIESDELAKIFQQADSDEIRSLIRKANREYLYWDKFKYKVPANFLEPRLAWFYLKFIRKNQIRFIPAKDKNGELFNYWLPEGVQENLHLVDCFAGGQIAVAEPILNKESRQKYLVRSLMEEAISSSLLEGAATTREKAKAMLLSGKKPVTHHDKMIYNNYQTIKNLGDFKDKALSADLLRDIHWTMTQGTLKDPDTCGRFRNKNDEPVVVSDDQGNLLYDPPPVGEIEGRVEELIQFANTEGASGEFIHPVVKAIMLHFLIGYIHPFVDGNGRTARALFYWYMLKKGYWLVEYMSISRIFIKSPSQYARAYLYSELDDRDLTYFISYNLKALRLAFQNLQSYILGQQKKVKILSDLFRKHPDLNSRQNMLLQHALRHPGMLYTIQKHKNYHGIVYQTARTDLIGLAKRKMMEKVKTGKMFYFVLNKDIEKKPAQ